MSSIMTPRIFHTQLNFIENVTGQNCIYQCFADDSKLELRIIKTLICVSVLVIGQG